MDIVRRLQNLFLFQIEAVERAVNEAKSFEELEERIEAISRRSTSELLRLAIAQLDCHFLEERDSCWEVVGFRSSSLLCCFGELRRRRRCVGEAGPGVLSRGRKEGVAGYVPSAASFAAGPGSR